MNHSGPVGLACKTDLYFNRDNGHMAFVRRSVVKEC